MKKILIVVTIAFTISLFSCEELKEKKFTSSKAELRQLVQETDFKKETSASYFLIGVSYNSSEEKITTVKVFAKVENRYRLIEMPIQDIRISINNNFKIPYIEVEYNSVNKLTDEELISFSWLAKIYVITCPENYLPKKLLPIGL